MPDDLLVALIGERTAQDPTARAASSSTASRARCRRPKASRACRAATPRGFVVFDFEVPRDGADAAALRPALVPELPGHLPPRQQPAEAAGDLRRLRHAAGAARGRQGGGGRAAAAEYDERTLPARSSTTATRARMHRDRRLPRRWTPCSRTCSRPWRCARERPEVLGRAADDGTAPARSWWTRSTLLEAAAQPGVTTKELDRIAHDAIVKARGAARVPGLPRLPGDAVHLGERGGRARHPRAEASSRRATSSASTSAASWTASTATPRARWRVGRVERRGRAADEGHAGVALRRDRACAGPASAWATSATRCRRTPRATATRWCGSSSATASARACTRSRRSRTTGPPGGASGWCRACAWPSSRWSTWAGPRSRCWRTAGPRSPRDGSLSAHFELSVAVTEHGPWILSEPVPVRGSEAAHA